jgi:hypothetical protein
MEVSSMSEHIQRDIGLSDFQEKQVRKPRLKVVFDQKYKQLMDKVQRFKDALYMTKMSSPVGI